MKKRAIIFFLATLFAKSPVFASDISLSIGAGGSVGGFFTRYWIAAEGEKSGQPLKIDAKQNMDQFHYGLYAFIDATYAELSISARNGVNSYKETVDMSIFSSPSVLTGSGWDTVLAFCFLGKYPIRLSNRSTIFPMAGAEYQFCLRQKRTDIDGSVYDRTDGLIERDKDGKPFGLDDWNALWLHIGGGVDFALAENSYLRCVLLYSIRTMTSYESKNLDYIKSDAGDPNPRMGGLASGPSLRISVGYKL
ncbi:MAG: hypothetical protein LBC99_02700 [Spirochaetota bacterium]|jgi:hypothetical protein|nr:hypothetical protein [Spirochaetota bacterium]